MASFMDSYDNDLVECIETAADIGYDVVEIPLLKPEKLDTEAINATLKNRNMVLCCGTGLSLDSDITSNDAKVREKGFNHLKMSVDLCHTMNSKLLAGVIYEPWGIPNRVISNNAREHMVEVLGEVARYAKDKQVDLALEVINRYEGRMINTVKQGRAIVDAIGEDNVGIHLDTYHMNLEEDDITSAIVESKDYMKHFHVSGNNRCAVGQGHIDWDSVFDALSRVNYKGFVNVECFVKSKNEVADSVFLWRDLDEPINMAKNSLEYIKTKIRSGDK